MKLLNCMECDDIVALTHRKRRCRCKKSSGKYINDLEVEYEGPSRIIGIDNRSYITAREGKDLTCFIIKEGCHITRTGMSPDYRTVMDRILEKDMDYSLLKSKG